MTDPHESLKTAQLVLSLYLEQYNREMNESRQRSKASTSSMMAVDKCDSHLLRAIQLNFLRFLEVRCSIREVQMFIRTYTLESGRRRPKRKNKSGQPVTTQGNNSQSKRANKVDMAKVLASEGQLDKLNKLIKDCSTISNEIQKMGTNGASYRFIEFKDWLLKQLECAQTKIGHIKCEDMKQADKKQVPTSDKNKNIPKVVAKN